MNGLNLRRNSILRKFGMSFRESNKSSFFFLSQIPYFINGSLKTTFSSGEINVVASRPLIGNDSETSKYKRAFTKNNGSVKRNKGTVFPRPFVSRCYKQGE